jgi:transposase
VRRIALLYRIERGAAAFDSDARHAYRQQHAVAAVHALHSWLRDMHPKVLGSGGTAKAIGYNLERWTALTRYLDDGRYPIDNTPVEKAFRPIAPGRKIWLHVGSEPAGRRACAIMSLLATAKANGHDPHAWLNDVLERLPTTLNRDIGMLQTRRLEPALRAETEHA